MYKGFRQKSIKEFIFVSMLTNFNLSNNFVHSSDLNPNFITKFCLSKSMLHIAGKSHLVRKMWTSDFVWHTRPLSFRIWPLDTLEFETAVLGVSYRAFLGFGQAKFAYGDSILGSRQFTLLPSCL